MRIAPHPRYRVEGRDIHVDAAADPLGGGARAPSVAVDTPGGEAKVRVRPGTSSGKRLRLKGRGMPNPQGRAPATSTPRSGSWCPRTLTDEERRLFEELATSLDVRPEERRDDDRLGPSAPSGLDLDAFARAAGLHPELVRRLVALGLLDADADAAGELWFPRPSSPSRPGCSGCGPASPSTTPRSASSFDLLDRIAELEAAQHPHRNRHSGGHDVDAERLTQKSQEALHDAQTKALRFGHTEVDGEHLLLALLDQPDGLVPAPARRRPAPTPTGSRADVEAELGRPAAGERARRRARARCS